MKSGGLNIGYNDDGNEREGVRSVAQPRESRWLHRHVWLDTRSTLKRLTNTRE